MQSVDTLISSADNGDRTAADTLFTTLYEELHRLARRELARRDRSGALGVTTLLHEAYLTMADRDGTVFPDRARFMAYAARVMRGLIIDEARARHAKNRGGGFLLTTLHTDVAEKLTYALLLAKIGDGLDELATHDPALAEIVELKFFCGFSVAEIAAMRGVSERTVKRSWEKSRLYLHRAIGSAPPIE